MSPWAPAPRPRSLGEHRRLAGDLFDQRRAWMDVLAADRFQDGGCQAAVAGRLRAVVFIASGTGLDRSTATHASRKLIGRLVHGLLSPVASNTSFCKRRPTSLPSDAVIGELSSLWSTIVFAISVAST